jgi:S-disulfanyl-L-cysteine oxidoreductase SoxD
MTVQRFSLTCLAVLAGLVAGGWARPVQTRTVFDGVYTVEQADRGRRQYVRDCAECHGSTLAGAEGGSALVGKEFLSHWDKKSVGELFDLVRKTMPDSAPGALTDRQYLDIVAYVLKENAFPAGKDELVRNETLNSIAFGQR